MRSLFLIGVVFLLYSCQNEKKATVKNVNSPEEVVRMWQGLMDKNAFTEAKKYSTPNTITVIESFESYFEEGDESLIDTTILLNLSCETEQEKAICHYEFEEDGERYRDSFQLKRVNGKWLIDVEESELLNEEGLEELFENVQDVFEEDLRPTKED